MTKGLKLLLWTVAFVVFNAILFLIVPPSNMSSSRWIAYGSILLSFATLIASTCAVPQGKSESGFLYGAALVSVAVKYFAATLAAGTLFFLVNFSSWRLTAIVLLILNAVFIIPLLIHLIANEYSKKLDAKDNQNLMRAKSLAYRLKMLMDQTSDAALKKKIEKAYDAMKSAQTAGGGAAAEIEQRMADTLAAFEKSVSEDHADASKLDAFVKLIREREMQLRLSRHQ